MAIITSKTRGTYNVKPPVGSQVNWGHPLAKGLVGCWLMNEGGGNKIWDLVNNLPATIYGATWGKDSKGSYLYFDGNDYVICAKNNILDNSPSLSLEVLNTPTVANNEMFVVSKGVDGGSPTSPYTWYGLSMASAGANRIYFEISNQTSTRFQCYPDSTTILNKNYHIFGTWNGTKSDPNMHIYFDSIRRPDINPAIDYFTGYIPSSSSNLNIGRQANWGGYFTGRIYFVKIYNRDLLPSEVRSLTAAPYQFIQAPRRFIISAPSGAVTTLTKSLYDNIAISDNIDKLFPVLIKSLSDNIAVSDNITKVIPALFKLLYDNLAVSDNVDKLIPQLFKSVYDNVAVSDTISPLVPVLLQTLYDAIAVSDTLDKDLPVTGTLTKSLFDNIAVSDNASTYIPVLVKAIYDNITVADTVDKLIPILYKVLSDNIAVSDYLNKSTPGAPEGSFYIQNTGTYIKIVVQGTEVMRINADGSIDVNGDVNANAF